MTTSPYIYQFDPAGDSTAAEVVRNVGEEKYVLELGCAYGIMTKVFVEHSRCKVFGIEYDNASAQHAKDYCDELKVLDIENVNWADVLEDRRFDVIVAADVLEHLRDPRQCLVSLRQYLKPDGYFVISIPNVAHNGIIAELLNEDFCYRQTGLLDATHLRFWAVNGITRLLNQSGFTISNLQTKRINADVSEFASSWVALPETMQKILESRPDGNVYQYIIKATPTNSIPSDEVISWPIRRGTPYVEELDLHIANTEVALADTKAALADTEAALTATTTQREELEALLKQIKQSKSWRITKPLRLGARVFRYGLLKEDQQRLINAIRYRYHQLPIPISVKRIISAAYHKGLRNVAHAITTSTIKTHAFQAPPTKATPRLDGLPDYIIWGVIDWHFRHQRPQQLASGLAKNKRRVFYISAEIMNDERAGFDIEPLDDSGILFQIKLYAKGAPSIYTSIPSIETIAQLRRSIGELLLWANCGSIVSLIEHPFWTDVATVLPNSHIAYDCMDHHDGFENTNKAMGAIERSLFERSHLIVTTSAWLDEMVAPHAKHRALIRNAVDYVHFSKAPDDIYQDPYGRRIIGYYGAIAEWFDLELVETVARQNPGCSILLIGADTINAKAKLKKCPNITFTGEVPYQRLPYYLYSFDVCVLPFKVIPLTMATNPVKVYEYLCAGKPVVTVDLPEIAQFNGLVYTASDKVAFLTAIETVLAQPEPTELVQRRKLFSAEQTWKHRCCELQALTESNRYDPLISVIVVTYNNLNLTQNCLSSLDEYSLYENLEIIVVDNASSDGSQAFLQEWVTKAENRKLILNDDNRGFAAANNQGLAQAKGEYLTLLNNDTHVTPGWARTLAAHLQRDSSIGLIGPVTNNIGNESKIDISYADMQEMLSTSAEYTRRHIGELYPLRTAAFFCVMFHRSTYELIGSLDEAFGRGFFEDDDYCRRIEQAGQRIVCAEDVFIHHHLSASFNKLKSVERQALFEANKALYEKKWGTWTPHAYRDKNLR